MLDFTIISTINHLEQKYWTYLDYKNRVNPEIYPMISFKDFILKEINWNEEKYKKNMNMYYKFQKKQPTAGGIIFNDKLELLLVKVYSSPVFGFPKGKAECNIKEKIHQTAIREIKEETGIDMTNQINEKSNFIKINRTIFYIIHNCKVNDFKNYNNFEIVDIQWHSIKNIKKHPELYSKQVKLFIDNMYSYQN